MVDKKLTRTMGFVAVLIFTLIAIATIILWTKEDKNRKDFLISLNLKLTMKIIAIKPTNDHGYGVIFGRLINSNKPKIYAAIFEDKYTFCKIEYKKVLFVSDYYVMEKNDSIVIDSKIAKYWIYRNGKLTSEYNLTITSDDFLYLHLHEKKYLDFSTYTAVK